MASLCTTNNMLPAGARGFRRCNPYPLFLPACLPALQGPGLACLEVYLRAAADQGEPDYQTSFGGWAVGHEPSIADFALFDLVGGAAAAGA